MTWLAIAFLGVHIQLLLMLANSKKPGLCKKSGLYCYSSDFDTERSSNLGRQVGLVAELLGGQLALGCHHGAAARLGKGQGEGIAASE
jgi:hypothetical protein